MTEAESHASIVNETGVTFDQLERIGPYKMRLLLGYKEPSDYSSRKSKDADILNEIKAFRMATLGR